MNHIFFIHSSVDGHVGCFHVPAIVNRAAMNFEVHVFFQTMFFSRYMPNSGIAGSYGSSSFIQYYFSVLEWCRSSGGDTSFLCLGSKLLLASLWVYPDFLGGFWELNKAFLRMELHGKKIFTVSLGANRQTLPTHCFPV